uniref:Venom protein n=1 Tax=Rhabditophanes sp. KR3021 TaxID=114890 RepID=A0AC35UD01_9BILA
MKFTCIFIAFLVIMSMTAFVAEAKNCGHYCCTGCKRGRCIAQRRSCFPVMVLESLYDGGTAEEGNLAY